MYLEVETDRYIKEDEIKSMKDLKKDILEITPKVKGIEDEESEFVNVNEKSFEEIFTEFYKKERDVEPDDELLKLLLSIMGEEEEADETN